MWPFTKKPAAEATGRNADPKVTKANAQQQQPATPATTGPQSNQEKDKFAFEDLRFPLDIGDSQKRLHWIKFTPCVQIASRYQQDSDGELSTADLHRATSNGAGGEFAASNVVSGEVALSAVKLAERFGGAVQELYKLEAPTPAAAGREATGVLVRQTAGLAADEAGILYAGGVSKAVNLTRKTRKAKASISLYMPDTVQTQMVTQFEPVSLTQALGKIGTFAAAGGSLGALVEKAEGFSVRDFVKTGLGKGGVGAGETGGVIEAAGAIAAKTGLLGENITDVLLFSGGLAQNPQVELLFRSISNREFQFDFKFVPKNSDDAKAIIKIIKAFRFFAAPELPETGTGRYFIPPSEFEIEFMIQNSRNEKLPQISTCVLEGIDVNYGSAGQWTAFQDGMPVEITMILRFKEVEIMHKKLIEEGY